MEEKRITKDFLKTLMKINFNDYYSTPYLNESLHLNCKGFRQIENLEEFTGLKVLYLERNGIQKIESLDN
jgi:dynein assembly factor 1